MRPTFVIAGAPRAGTTWLYDNLSKHPGVFLTPNKEPRFYSVRETDRLSFSGPGDERWLSNLVQDRKSYEALYSGAQPGQLRGEASSDYLYRSEVAAVRLHQDVPSARVIFILRNPVHRAYSNWLQHVQYGREQLSFGGGLDAEEERIERGWAWWWHYTKRGFYSEQLEPFLDAFPSDRVLILLHDELQQDPQGLLRKACAFLDIDPVLDDQVVVKKNHSVVARSPAHRTARRVLKPIATASGHVLPENVEERMRRWYQRKTLEPSMSDADRRRLHRTFSTDIERLAGMTGLDLSRWLD